MAALTAGLGALIALHVLTICLAAVRFVYRRRKLWHDDFLAAVTTCAELPMLAILIYVLTQPSLRPAPFHMALSAYFFVLWTSRATIAMTTSRVYASHGGLYIRRFTVLATVLASIGIVYGIMAAHFCVVNSDCDDSKSCFCRLPLPLAICAIVTDIFVDIGVVIINWDMLADLKSRNVDARKKWLVLLGFSSSICTLIINVAYWASYFAYVPEKPLLFLCLANAVAITSGISCHTSVVLGLIGRVIFEDSSGPQTADHEMSFM